MERRLMQIEDNIQNTFLRDNMEIKEKLQIQEKRINDQQQRLQIQENIIKNQEEEKNIYKEKQQSTEKRLERLEVLAEEFNKMKKEIEKLKTEKANNLHNENQIDEKRKPQEKTNFIMEAKASQVKGNKFIGRKRNAKEASEKDSH